MTERWKVHFEELPNLTNISSTIEADLEDDGGLTLVSLEEVTQVVKQLCRDKAKLNDAISSEMLKTLGVEGLLWVTLHSKIV